MFDAEAAHLVSDIREQYLLQFLGSLENTATEINKSLTEAFHLLEIQENIASLKCFHSILAQCSNILFQDICWNSNYPNNSKIRVEDQFELIKAIKKVSEQNIANILKIKSFQQIVFQCLGHYVVEDYDGKLIVDNNKCPQVLTYFFENSAMFLALNDVKYCLLIDHCYQFDEANEIIQFYFPKESLKLRIPKPEMEFLIKVLETKGFKENMESGFLEPETVIFESIEANVYFSCAKEQTSKKKYFCISMKNTELYCCIGSITRQLEFDELTFNENLKCFTFNDPYSWKYGATIYVYLNEIETNVLKKKISSFVSKTVFDTKKIEAIQKVEELSSFLRKSKGCNGYEKVLEKILSKILNFQCSQILLSKCVDVDSMKNMASDYLKADKCVLNDAFLSGQKEFDFVWIFKMIMNIWQIIKGPLLVTLQLWYSSNPVACSIINLISNLEFASQPNLF